MTKEYYGPGVLVWNGVTRGRRFNQLTTKPAFSVTPNLYYGGDMRHVQPEEWVMEASVNRTSLSEPYYYYPMIQHFNRSTFRSGHSGYDARITSTTAPGATTITVNDTSPFAVGMDVMIDPYSPTLEYAQIIGINPGTGELTFVHPLTYAHTNTGFSAVTTGARTNTSIYQTEFSVEGNRTGGDFIGHVQRIAANPTHNTGRDHAFDRTTIGYMAGDAFGLTDGVYIAGYEHHYYDKGNSDAADIFVIDSTKSFIRENSTGARGCVWLGTLYKSEGSKYCNAAHVVTGKWLRGLDTVLADLGTDRAAINMASGQRIYFGSTSNPDVDGFRFWGDTLGLQYITGDTDGNGRFLEMNVEGVPALRARSTGISVGGTATTTGDILPGGHIRLTQGKRIYFGTDTYLIFDGSAVYLVTNGGPPKNLSV